MNLQYYVNLQSIQKLKLVESRANHIYHASITHIIGMIDEGEKKGHTNNKR